MVIHVTWMPVQIVNKSFVPSMCFQVVAYYQTIPCDFLPRETFEGHAVCKKCLKRWQEQAEYEASK